MSVSPKVNEIINRPTRTHPITFQRLVQSPLSFIRSSMGTTSASGADCATTISDHVCDKRLGPGISDLGAGETHGKPQ